MKSQAVGLAVRHRHPGRAITGLGAVIALTVPAIVAAPVAAIAAESNSVILLESQEYQVPASVRHIAVIAAGGQGGDGGDAGDSVFGSGGLGEVARAELDVEPGTHLWVTVGAAGDDGESPGAGGVGGTAAVAAFNGGPGGRGAGGAIEGGGGGGGGAASGARFNEAGSTGWIVIAGGGGGGGGASDFPDADDVGAGGEGGRGGLPGEQGWGLAGGGRGAVGATPGPAQVGTDGVASTCGGGGGGGGGGYPTAGGGGSGGGRAGHACDEAGGGGGGAGGRSEVLAPALPGSVDADEAENGGDGWVEIVETISYATEVGLSWEPGAITGHGNAISATVHSEDGSVPAGSVEFVAISTVSGSRTHLGAAVLVDAHQDPAASVATVYAVLPAGEYCIEATFAPAPGSLFEASLFRTTPGNHYQVAKGQVLVEVGELPLVPRAGAALALPALVTAAAPARGPVDGAVRLMVDDQALGEPITVADGRVQATARLHAGSHVISASFLGSESFNPADSEHVAVNVLKSVPSVRLTVVDTVFDSITATAGDVSVMAPEGVPWAPTGTVTVHDSATGAQVGEADLVGTSGLTRVNLLLPKGAHRLFAVYGGDSDFESGISPVASAEVAGRAVKVDVWGSPSPVYQGEAFAVGGRVSTLATAPFEVTGSIQFLVDGIAVDGPVALTLAAGTKDIFGLTAGKHQLRAHFLGDAHFDPAFSDPLTIEVNPSHGHGVKVDAWAGPSPVLEGDTVTVGSRVVPNADLPFRVSGSVQFLVDGIAADGPKGISNGIASGELRGLSAGPHTVRAHFLGDSHFGSALSKPVTIQVNPSRGHGARVDVWAGPSPVVEGNTVTVGGRVARLADLPFQISGSVQFLVDGIAVDGPVVLVDGVGAAEARALAVGAHVVQAHYLGDAHFEPALSEPVTIQVNARPKRAPVSLTVAKTRSKHTGTIVVTAKAVPVVEGFNATGLTARFFANGKQVGRTVTDKRGAAVLTLRDNRLKLGENPIVARVYPVGDQWVSSVTATTVIKVNTRPAATVSVKAAPDPRTGQLVVNASIKPRVTGYAVAGRLFAVRAHGKTIATARADRRGRVVFIVPVSKLGRGLTPIVVDCFSGSPRYTKAKSRSYVVHVNGWGRITSVEVAK